MQRDCATVMHFHFYTVSRVCVTTNQTYAVHNAVLMQYITLTDQMENVMLESPGEPVVVKLIDFGLSQVFAKGEKMRTACGTV